MFHCVCRYNFQRSDGSWHNNPFYERCCQAFNGTFDLDCQLKSISIQLLTLVNMLIDGPTRTAVSQASLSIAQLIFSNFKQAPGRNATAFCRDNINHETPLKRYNSLKMISDARSKKLVESSHRLGLGASYSWTRNVIKNLSKLSIYQYQINGVFTPRSLKRNVFTVIAKDNIDKNARSNTASPHYHGISKTVMQFPKTNVPIDNLAIHPINEEDGYDLTSIPSSYSIVPQVNHHKEPLHPLVLTFKVTVNGLADIFKQALIEECRWLEIIVETHQTDSIIPSWSKYHSNKERNVPSVKGYRSLLPLIDAPVYTIISQYHCMNIIIKTIEYLSSGQIAVDVCDLPVSVLTKDIQYRNPEKFGPGKYFCWMGGLHIEMCILAIHDELIDGSGLHEILSKGNMSIIKLKIF